MNKFKYLFLLTVLVFAVQTFAMQGCKHEFTKPEKITHYEAYPRHKISGNYKETNVRRVKAKSAEPTVLAAVAPTPVAGLKNYAVNFKVLIISAVDKEKDDPGLIAAKQALDNMWIPYDVLVLTQEGLRKTDVTLDLVNPDGSGKYIGIILTERDLSFKNKADPKEKFIGALSADEKQTLTNYTAKYNARLVSLFTYPQEAVGVKEIENVNHFEINAVTFTEGLRDYAQGFEFGREVGLRDNWHYPVEIIPSKEFKTEPIAYYSNIKNSVAGIINKFPNGREEMHFFFSQSKTALITRYFSPIWIKWLTKNLYLGKRRVYLTAQVDDFFIPTDLWDVNAKKEPAYGTNLFRIKKSDVANLIRFQNGDLRDLTGDDEYKIEMAYNGFGIDSFGGVKLDELALYTFYRAHEFSWVSHTYTHLELTKVNYTDAFKDINSNIDFSQKFLKSAWENITFDGIVTPRISGLFNGEALRAIHDNGIKYVIGDNTKPKLVSPVSKHWPRITTQELNGFDGLYIIPRYPNDIFYNISTINELETIFNHFYKFEEAYRYNAAKILNKNAREATLHLLDYDYAPYMFHQANLRTIEYEGKAESLMSLWFKNVISEYRKYSNLPMPSATFKKLSELYIERMNYDKCEVTAKFFYVDKLMDKITINSKNKCAIPITGVKPQDITAARKFRSETYGPDHTLYVDTEGKSEEITVQFGPQI